MAPLAGCLSAETSEASQLSRLERGIDQSTTAVDRFNSGGEVMAGGKPQPLPTPPPGLAAATGPAPREADEVRQAPATHEGDPEDTTPRPTIRIWGSPSGHGAPPGFVPVAKIEEPGSGPLAPAK
jgi:hypothetical protein